MSGAIEQLLPLLWQNFGDRVEARSPKQQNWSFDRGTCSLKLEVFTSELGLLSLGLDSCTFEVKTSCSMLAYPSKKLKASGSKAQLPSKKLEVSCFKLERSHFELKILQLKSKSWQLQVDRCSPKENNTRILRKLDRFFAQWPNLISLDRRPKYF